MTEQDLLLAKDYAQKMLTRDRKDRVYQDRGQSNRKTIHTQCLYSQLSELAVYRAFREFNLSPPTGFIEGDAGHTFHPDHEYHYKNQRGYFHDKSQNLWSSENNGSAWMTGDGPYTDRHLMLDYSEDDYLALSLVDVRIPAKVITCFGPL